MRGTYGGCNKTILSCVRGHGYVEIRRARDQIRRREKGFWEERHELENQIKVLGLRIRVEEGRLEELVGQFERDGKMGKIERMKGELEGVEGRLAEVWGRGVPFEVVEIEK